MQAEVTIYGKPRALGETQLLTLSGENTYKGENIMYESYRRKKKKKESYSRI